jgi:hypothetical protein
MTMACPTTKASEHSRMTIAAISSGRPTAGFVFSAAYADEKDF